MYCRVQCKNVILSNFLKTSILWQLLRVYRTNNKDFFLLNNLYLLMRGFKGNTGALLWFDFYFVGWKRITGGVQSVPCIWSHSLHRRAIACRTLAKMPGLCLIWSNAVNTRSICSCLVLTGLMYTTPFTWPQRKKSRGVRSGDLAGHAKGPPLPIHFSL